MDVSVINKYAIMDVFELTSGGQRDVFRGWSRSVENVVAEHVDQGAPLWRPGGVEEGQRGRWTSGPATKEIVGWAAPISEIWRGQFFQEGR